MTGIRDWLAQQGLEKYAAVFAEHEITLDVLADLTESDIDRLSLPTGPRRRVIVAVRALAAASRATPSNFPTQAPLEPLPLSRNAERRQLTVMFCDLVGSTELSQRIDPEALRELMQAYYKVCGEVVARYNGQVAQYWGDGLMVYFGWPTAHEDDAAGAVRSGLDIIQAVKTVKIEPALTVRIGIATGTVVVGLNSFDEDSANRLAVGETPNLASRLQGLAGPDEIVVSPETRHLLGSVFELTDLGAHSLRGIARAVRAWRVDALRRMLGRFEAAHDGEALMPMVGREEEIAILLRRWQLACRGEGQVVLVRGEPGIGKSRLTHALQERVSATPHVVMRYQCSQYHLNSALYPVKECIELAANIRREDSLDEKLDKLEALLVGNEAQRAVTAPLVAALLELHGPRYRAPQLSAQKQKERTLEVLIRQLELLGASKPVLILFEDAQWIDPTTQEWLDAVIARMKDMRVLLMITFRPEYAPHWAEHAHVTMLSLSRLGKREGAELVANVARGRTLPQDLLTRIVTRTDGVPLFVEELTKSVLESGLLREEGGQYTAQDPNMLLEIPTSLRDSLLARLDRLSPVKDIIEIGACIGREFSFELMARISALREEQLKQGLNVLTEAGLLYRRGVPPHAVYTFKHALVQDVAYDSLLKSKRQQLHAQLAQVLEQEFHEVVAHSPEVLGHHHTQSGDLVAAVPWWCEAGQLAVRRVALREAVGHFQRGITLIHQMPPTNERDALELSLRQPLHGAWIGLRGWSSAEVSSNGTAMLELAERQSDAKALGMGLWAIWVNTITQGRVADSLEWGLRMLTEGEERRDVDLQIFGHAGSMISQFYLGSLLEAKAHGEKVLALYHPQHAARWMQVTANDFKTVVGIWECQWIWMLGYPDQAVRVSDEKDAYARELGHPFNLGFALSLGAYGFDYRCEPERMLERVAEADRLERDQSVPFVNQVMVRQAEGLARLRMGQYADAITLLRQALDNWNKYGGQSRVPYLKSALAEAVARHGDLKGGLALIEECLAQIERPGWQERSHYAEVLRLKAWMLIQQKKDSVAEVLLRASIDWARHQQAKSWELRSSTTLAELLNARGKRDDARAVLAPVYKWFKEGFDTHDLKVAKRVLDSLD